MKCEYCTEQFGKVINIKASPSGKESQPKEMQILQLPFDSPGIVLYRYGLAQGVVDIKYCPMCGKKWLITFQGDLPVDNY